MYESECEWKGCTDRGCVLRPCESESDLDGWKLDRPPPLPSRYKYIQPPTALDQLHFFLATDRRIHFTVSGSRKIDIITIQVQLWRVIGTVCRCDVRRMFLKYSYVVINVEERKMTAFCVQWMKKKRSGLQESNAMECTIKEWK